MKKIENNWVKLVLVGTALILIYKLINNFSEIREIIDGIVSILFPFLLGGVIAFFLYIPAYRLEKLVARINLKLVQKNARVIGTLLLYLIIFLIITLSIVYIIPRLYKNIEELIGNIPRYLDIVDEFLAENKYLSRISTLDILDVQLEEYLNMEKFNKYISVIGNVANSFISVFVSIVVSIYIIIDRDSIMKYIRKLRRGILGSRFNTMTVYVKKIVMLFYSYFSGLATDAVIAGVISVIGLSVMKVPYALLLGVIVAIGNMIPFFGPIVSTILVALISLISGGIWRLIPVMIFMAVLYIMDGYLIQPRIIGKSTGIRPLLVLVAVLVFGDLFGILGMIAGVPLIATLKMILDDYLDDGKIDGSAV